MYYFIVTAVGLLSSMIGAICGVGGGIVIKPVLDLLGIMSVAEASFLSGCTVLAMTTYAVLRSRAGGKSRIDFRSGTCLAVGAVIGGVLGKALFQNLWDGCQDKNAVGAVQAVCLLAVTSAALLYTISKNKIHTLAVRSIPLTVLIGMALGLVSSFLGIGGGPVNLVALFFFFSMETKKAAENSLYIIMFSQASSLLGALLSKSAPEMNPLVLILMICGGIFGGVIGRKLNAKITDAHVDRLSVALMSLIIALSACNLVRFLGA